MSHRDICPICGGMYSLHICRDEVSNSNKFAQDHEIVRLKAENERIQNRLLEFEGMTFSENETIAKMRDEIELLTFGLEATERVYNMNRQFVDDAKLEIYKSRQALLWLVDHDIEYGAISRAKGAELLGIPLIDLDVVLAAAKTT